MGGHEVAIGVPQYEALQPCDRLYAHMVTTRNGHEAGRFGAELESQLGGLGVQGRARADRRRTFSIHGKKIVGFSVTVNGLSGDASLLLQAAGLGGRRKMGCGFFMPGEKRS